MVQKCRSMKNATKALFGILVVTVAVSALVAPVSGKFVHPRGMFMSTYPPEILVFGGAPVEYTVDIAVIIYPPWYFVQDQMGFDSVTLTMELVSDCASCRTRGGDPPTLLGAINGKLVARWSTLTMTEEENGAFLLTPITLVITGETGFGYYMLYLTAEGDSNNLTFIGRDEIPVAVAGWYV